MMPKPPGGTKYPGAQLYPRKLMRSLWPVRGWASALRRTGGVGHTGVGEGRGPEA